MLFDPLNPGPTYELMPIPVLSPIQFLKLCIQPFNTPCTSNIDNFGTPFISTS